MLILPAIDIFGGKCVRLKQGDFNQSKTYNEDPLIVAQEFKKKGAEFIHIVDLEGAKEKRPMNKEIILNIAKTINLPIQVGGGIRSYEDAKAYLDNGITRIIVSSMATRSPNEFKRIIKEFGSSRIVFSLDIRDGKFAISGWTESSEKSVTEIIEFIKNAGIKIVVVTDTAKDGMLAGPNFEIAQKIMDEGFETIVAGGVSSIKDVLRLKKMGLRNVIIGKALYEGLDLKEVIYKANDMNKNNLVKRIIPCLDVKDGRVVKGIYFKNLKDAGDPVELGKFYSDSGADELIFLDITATKEDRKTFQDLVGRIAKEINIPFTVGGGIKSITDMKELLAIGADKVSIGSAAVKNPNLVKEASQYFGAQCIVVSVDAKKKNDSWEIYIKGGSEATGIDAISFAKEMGELGAGELLVNSLDRDGTKAGFDLELLNAICNAVNIPVIASSGAGSAEDFVEVFQKTNVDAGLAASIFHNGTVAISDLKKVLKENNIPVR